MGLKGDDDLYGGAGDDLISGDAGIDFIEGHQGLDELKGDAGRDRFLFSGTNFGIGRITDFNAAQDFIAIDVANYNSPNDFHNFGLKNASFIEATQFHIGTGATLASHRFIYNRSNGALFFDQDGSGAAAQVQIAILSPNLNLTHHNFFAFNQLPQLDNIERLLPPTVPQGSSSNDTLWGSDRGETMNGFGGNDTLLGGDGNDYLSGGAGADLNKGGAGSDYIEGGTGNDWLWGSTGRNILVSNAGADGFVLERGQGQQRILDFKNNQDVLGLTRGIKFRKLDIDQRGRNTIISLNGDRLAILVGVRADQITAADFTPAPVG